MPLRSFFISGLLHSIIILLCVFGLPSLWKKEVQEESQVVVELLPIASETNAPNSRIKPHKEKKEKPKERVEEKQLPDITPKPAPKIEPPKTPTPPVKKEATEKIQEPKKPLPPKQEDFDSVQKQVDQLEKSHKEVKQEKEDPKLDLDKLEESLSSSENTQYKPGLPLSMSERDAIKNKIIRVWSFDEGAKGVREMVVVLEVHLNRDGTVQSIVNKDDERAKRDGIYRALVESAVRAVRRAAPFTNLPPEKYDTRDGWREMEISMRPLDVM